MKPNDTLLIQMTLFTSLSFLTSLVLITVFVVTYREKKQ